MELNDTPITPSLAPIVLTPKQQKFCDEYLKDLNASQAALRAGYSGHTALNGQLMAIPKIRLYLQERTQEVSKKVQLGHETILTELSKIAFGNMGNYFRSDGTMKAMHELTPEEKAGLWSVTISNGDTVTTRIRMNNKMAALEKIAKHLRFYETEPAEPEVKYVYIDKDNLDAQDKFDDALFENDDDEDDEEYFDEDNEDYYPWDTECKVAVAQARAACRARAKLLVASDELSVDVDDDDEDEVDEDEDESKESGIVSQDNDDDVPHDWANDPEAGKYADPEPPQPIPLPAPEYLTDEVLAILLKQKEATLSEGWLTAKKLPDGANQKDYNQEWKKEMANHQAEVQSQKYADAPGLFGRLSTKKPRSEKYYG